jgi:hypothetical protein
MVARAARLWAVPTAWTGPDKSNQAARLEKRHGARFKPSRRLKDMAGKGETFYGRFAPPRRTAA